MQLIVKKLKPLIANKLNVYKKGKSLVLNADPLLRC